MKILIDMDNTLNKLWIPFIEYYNKYFDQDVFLKREDLKSYHILSNLNIPAEDEKRMKNKIFSSPGFWDSLPVFDEYTLPIMEELYSKHDVYICTSPWYQYLDCYKEKIQWIYKYMPYFDIDKVIFIKHKYLVKADWIIDDYSSNLKHDINKIIIDYPYNRDIEDGNRVDGWKEIGKILL